MADQENPWKVSVKEEMNKNPQLKLQDIQNIRAWLSTQSHLPYVYDEQIAQFLHACYFDVEQTKSTIDCFYTYKSTMQEFFANWDPCSVIMQNYANNVLHAAVLPRKMPHEHQIVVLRLSDTNPDSYEFATSVKWLIMTVTRLQMESGTHTGYKLVYDATGYTMTHLLRNPLPSVKNYILFGQNASSIRVDEIHFINSSPVIKKLITILKPLLNKELMKMISFHTSSDGFFKNVAKEIVPEDYGGSGPSVESLHRDNVAKMAGYREIMKSMEARRADISKRKGKSKKYQEDIAVESFKKLDID